MTIDQATQPVRGGDADDENRVSHLGGGALPAVDAVVGLLGAHLLDLAARAPYAPSLVRACAGDVSVEIGWAPTAAGPAPANPAAARTRWSAAPSALTSGPAALTSTLSGAADVPGGAGALPNGNGATGAVNGAASAQGVAVNGAGGTLNGTGGTAATTVTDEPGTFIIGSPSVGMFYRSPEPGKPPFVAEGDIVRAGQQVGIVEAMKLMIPIEADRGGRVVRVLVEDASAIEHDQPLLVLAPVAGAGATDGNG
ncbi:acetyl-CoA carboxylase biotin carboxyl carrier protein subunit [Frankia sp. AgPm24]|uniref:acetyl-CoA carboxylase biotin carboxyl carrier protein n=1 Tax=Frankia sp. AgPm24 TaxID=631128 RepID=UPI00200C2EF7|nr:biotin/lipoyl-containing protein [Frankia sp. AgPm24]MCK9923615.1 acetyl-CoA carboxylase biotin carboxyl carrier protein subunit [Frankia sp. AgPm24]